MRFIDPMELSINTIGLLSNHYAMNKTAHVAVTATGIVIVGIVVAGYRTKQCGDTYGTGFYHDKRRGCDGIVHRV
jgi:hypothetical protein